MASGFEEMQRSVSIRRLVVEVAALFTAVFAGFLADDYRDFRSDRAREAAALRQIVRDLELDSADFTPIVPSSRLRVEKLLWLSNASSRGLVPTDSLTALIDTLGQYPYWTYEASASTYSGLKATQGLDLILDDSLRNGLIYYFEDGQPVLEEWNSQAADTELEWWDRMAPYVEFLEADSLYGYPRVRVTDPRGLLRDKRLRFSTISLGGWHEVQIESGPSWN